jgi:CRP/FNR family cyclic AMP-dependent transcriptional regulator
MSDIKRQNHSLHIEEVTPILNKISIFGGLSEKQLYTLFQLLEQVSYKKDEYVFRQGDEPSHIYVVISGTVKLIMEEYGTPLELIAFSAGHNFGETAVIGIQPHSASALAVEDTELIVLSRQALLSLAESDPKLFGILILNIAREACRRIHNTDETLLHYFCKK